MLKITLSKIKRALAHGPRCRCTSRSFSGRNHRLSITVLKRAEKSTKAGKKNEAQCRKCKQLIDFIFGPPSTINSPHHWLTIEKNDKTVQGMAASQLDFKHETSCEKCSRLIAQAFGTDEIDIKIPKKVTELPKDDIHALQSTTAKQTEERLAQKIEIIDETSLVEAEKLKLEGFNVTPRVLGHLAEMNIIRTIEFLSNDDHHEIPLLHFAAVNSGHNSKSGGTDEDLDPFEILAKRCLNVPSDRIDDNILKQMKQSSVLTRDSKQQPVQETETIEEIEPSKFVSDSTTHSEDEQLKKNVHNSQTESYPGEQVKATAAQVYSASNFKEQTLVSQLSNTYPTKEEISQGLPDPQSFYTGFKLAQPVGGEADTPKHLQENLNHGQSTGYQHFYNNGSNYPYTFTPQFPQGFYYPEGYWSTPREGHRSYTPNEKSTENVSVDLRTIHADQKTPNRAIEGRPNINLSQETFMTVPYGLEKPSQSLLRPEYICPAPNIQAKHEPSSPNHFKEQISEGSLQEDQFSRLPRNKMSENQLKYNYFPKKEIGHGLVLQESFYASSKAEINEPSLPSMKAVPQVLLEKRAIYPDEKTPIRAIEVKSAIGTDSNLTNLCSVLCPSPELQLKHQEIALSDMLHKIRQRGLKNKVAPVKGKCGKGRRPRCPPPTPQCPPPDPCPPRPCPPREPPCPKPCKRACPPACTPPSPACDPRNNPCKFKKIFLSDSLLNIFTQLFCFGSKKLPYRKSSSLPMINYQTQSVDFSTTAVLTKDVVIPVQYNLSCCLFLKTQSDADLEKYDWTSKTIALARTFDPWVPIPSWPIPKKVEKKPFVCPKEGCKVIPPPRLGAPCDLPCKGGDPCINFPKRRS